MSCKPYYLNKDGFACCCCSALVLIVSCWIAFLSARRKACKQPIEGSCPVWVVQMGLHQQFLAGLAVTYHPLINLGNLHACQSPALRSHTLVRTVHMLMRPVLLALALQQGNGM